MLTVQGVEVSWSCTGSDEDVCAQVCALFRHAIDLEGGKLFVAEGNSRKRVRRAIDAYTVVFEVAGPKAATQSLAELLQSAIEIAWQSYIPTPGRTPLKRPCGCGES